jgi:hypothetical protein
MVWSSTFVFENWWLFLFLFFILKISKMEAKVCIVNFLLKLS